jgi:hypothetical protein
LECQGCGWSTGSAVATIRRPGGVLLVELAGAGSAAIGRSATALALMLMAQSAAQMVI